MMSILSNPKSIEIVLRKLTPCSHGVPAMSFCIFVPPVISSSSHFLKFYLVHQFGVLFFQHAKLFTDRLLFLTGIIVDCLDQLVA
mmetsp:Transcript_52311/g.152290  ORF Transcript_52311/g.152290 Transcript_52311/m.152290 type:complete len:85 (+) Transcript_52311:80-334(+)